MNYKVYDRTVLSKHLTQKFKMMGSNIIFKPSDKTTESIVIDLGLTFFDKKMLQNIYIRMTSEFRKQLENQLQIIGINSKINFNDTSTVMFAHKDSQSLFIDVVKQEPVSVFFDENSKPTDNKCYIRLENMPEYQEVALRNYLNKHGWIIEVINDYEVIHVSTYDKFFNEEYMTITNKKEL